MVTQDACEVIERAVGAKTVLLTIGDNAGIAFEEDLIS